MKIGDLVKVKWEPIPDLTRAPSHGVIVDTDNQCGDIPVIAVLWPHGEIRKYMQPDLEVMNESR